MRTALIVAAVAVIVAAPVKSADRNYSVTDFNRVRVQGPYAVTMVTGVAPFARASGGQAGLDRVNVAVEGQTLVIQSSRSSGSGGDDRRSAGPVTIAIGTHDLQQAIVSGSGSLSIDRARGQKLVLGASGAASLSLASADVDTLDVTQLGDGSVKLGGRANVVVARVSGTGEFDSSGLKVADLTLGVAGSASAHAAATDKAAITASGSATVAIDGKAACTVKANGSATVSGC
ncbi:DUF2807 domain-containing protein [Sphingomonas sp. ASV193]|uniref:GIN domain-containing protein n=1 Tax=Sphingomonas sp. ASV193 TaxID=3144405 RepID=UPI0032E90596